MKKMGIIVMALAAANTILTGNTKIDLNTYVVKIVKNASEKSIQSAIKDLKFTYGMGDPAVKVLDKVDFSCKSLGLKKSSQSSFPDHVTTVYKKEIEPNVEGVCEEAVYKDGKLTKALLMEW
jgi:hypothetical protein